MKNPKVIRVIRISLIVIIALTLIFIYTRSMKSPSESKDESNRIGEIIALIISPDTWLGAFIQSNIRKLAHFAEFFALGLEITLYALLFVNRFRDRCLFCPLGVILALFDETIQIFTERGPSISDVWIDFFGYLTAMLLMTGAFTLVKMVKNKQGKRTNQL